MKAVGLNLLQRKNKKKKKKKIQRKETEQILYFTFIDSIKDNLFLIGEGSLSLKMQCLRKHLQVIAMQNMSAARAVNEIHCSVTAPLLQQSRGTVRGVWSSFCTHHSHQEQPEEEKMIIPAAQLGHCCSELLKMFRTGVWNLPARSGMCGRDEIREPFAV